MTSDNSATITYVMWREEHPWNGSMLQRAHLLQSCLTSVSLIIPINWSRKMHGRRLVIKWKHPLSYELIFTMRGREYGQVEKLYNFVF
jgi:hypothetical protein